MIFSELGLTEGESSSDLFLAAVKTANSTTLLGDVNSENILYLAHYSKDRDIQGFYYRPDICVWTNGLTAKADMIYPLTAEMNPSSYKALYVIRIGVHNGDPFEDRRFIDHYDFRADRECALAFAVPASHFAMIKIELDKTTQKYVVI